MKHAITTNTTLLTGLHLLVDGLCACCVFMMAPWMQAGTTLTLFVAYNALAFLTQPLMGLWTDRRKDATLIFKASMTLLTLGACLTILGTTWQQGWLPYLSVTLIGMGNSMFHVYGGKSVAVHTGNDMRHLGLFVSSGAIGLIVGETYASTTGLTILCLAMLLLAWFQLRSALPTPAMPPATLNSQGNMTTLNSQGGAARHMCIAMIAFICLVVFFRALVGKMAPSGPGESALLIAVLAFAGKSLGGFAGRRWGVWRTLTLTLLVSGTCLIASYAQGSLILPLTLAINLTMPLTLWLANQQMPGHEGLSFGLLAAMLPLGVALGSYCADSAIANALLCTLVATIVIEALVLLAMNEKRWQVLAMSMVMNILTNLPLNILVLSHPNLHESLPHQLLLELAVVAIETLLYFAVLRHWRQALTYAILCNAISYLCGMLYQVIFTT